MRDADDHIALQARCAAEWLPLTPEQRRQVDAAGKKPETGAQP
jgi:hypothetical protein